MQELRNKSKYKGIKHYVYSTKYSLDGLLYAYKNEKSLWMHAFCSIVGISLGIIFKISLIQWSMILISLGFILAIELLNTAIEAVVDMVTLEYHPLAKIAKDCGSAASFIAVLISLIISGFVFIPKFMILFHL